MKGRGDKAGCPADEFIGRARQQIEKPVLVGRVYRVDFLVQAGVGRNV